MDIRPSSQSQQSVHKKLRSQNAASSKNIQNSFQKNEKPLALAKFTMRRRAEQGKFSPGKPYTERLAKQLPSSKDKLVFLTKKLRLGHLNDQNNFIKLERRLAEKLIAKIEKRLNELSNDDSQSSLKNRSDLKAALKKAQKYQQKAAEIEAKQLMNEAIWLMDTNELKTYTKNTSELIKCFKGKNSNIVAQLEYFKYELKVVQAIGTTPLLSESEIVNRVEKGVYNYSDAQELLEKLDLINVCRQKVSNQPKCPRGMKPQVLIQSQINAVNDKTNPERLKQAKETLEATVKNHAENRENIITLFEIAKQAAKKTIEELKSHLNLASGKSTSGTPEYPTLEKMIKKFIEEMEAYEQEPDLKKQLEYAKQAPKIFKKYLKETKKQGILKTTSSFQAQPLQANTVARTYKQYRNQLLNQNHWRPIHNDILLPNESSVSSQITPAGNILKKAYQGLKGICSSDINSYHAVNLAHTELRDKQGKLIWKGSRHGVHCAAGINDFKQRLEANKNRIREEMQLIWHQKIEHFKELHAIEPKSPSEATEYNHLIKELRGERPITVNAIGLETASILTNLEANKFKHANKRDDFNRNNEHLHVQEQMEAWHLVKKEGISLELPEEVVALIAPHAPKQNIPIYINPTPITMNFGVNVPATLGFGVVKATHLNPLAAKATGWADVERANAIAMAHLFTNNEIDFMKADSIQLDISLLQLARINEIDSEVTPSININNLKATGINGIILQAIEDEKDTQKQKVMLKLMRDIVHIFLTDSYKDAGKDPYKLVSRLSVLSHFAGIDVSFNCKSGKDRTGMNDAMSKFIAYKAHLAIQKSDLSLIPDFEAPLDKEDLIMLAKFVIETGNLEVQQYNTGVPGYKTGTIIFDKYFAPLKTVQPELYKEVLQLYKGLSSYVSS